MSFTNFCKWIVAGSLCLSILSCTEKVETGSILQDFTGIAGVEPLSPTAVRVYWNLHDRYKSYSVYRRGVTTALAETARSEVIIRGLTAGTSYTFKVAATDGTLSVGGSKEISATTLTPFKGVSAAAKNAEGNIVVTWAYDAKVGSYQIFMKKYEDPTAANTSNWTSVDYTSIDTKYTFKGLEGSTRYHFVVQAKYLDETYEYPTKAVSVYTDSTFPTPAYSLSPISIGSLPYAKVTPVVNTTYLNKNYTSRMYSGDTPISDPLVGVGTLVFSPPSGVTNGKVSDLALHVSYNDGAKTETLIFDKLTTYIKGILGLQETLPLKVLDSGVAFMGEALTTGDFNCDGYPDLAVGMPNISIISAGATQPQVGAVYVYYSVRNSSTGVYSLNTSGTPSRNPANPGVDPQILTFDDLNLNAHFGKSLAGNGNLNGDTLLGKACQDLLVGAPGYDTAETSGADMPNDGAAFVFFGSSKGLKSPSKIKDLQQNVETCNGLVEDATCSAVMLWPDMSILPSAYIDKNKMIATDNPQFGYSVAFVGDFNADGYDDIAVGAPTAPWDGNAAPDAAGRSRFLNGVGYVAMFFGSKNGLGYETPFATSIPTSSDTKFRFLKIFPPIPHKGQNFGYSVAGGADVDGLYRVRNSAGKLVGGSDLIIGAPGDRYPRGSTNAKMPVTSSCETNTNPDACKSFGFNSGGWGESDTTVGSTQYYGLPYDSSTTTGAAYLYFGRGATSPPDATTYENPSRQSFWQCGNRLMPDKQHFSCMASSASGRVLFPRSGYKTDGSYKLSNSGFGTAVALVGDPSHYDSNNVAITNPSDTNGDGYADAVVVSSSFTNYTKGNSGALWTFYGNPARLYEYTDFKISSDKNLDWNDSLAQCQSFATTSTLAIRQQCAPTLLRSNSIGANFQMGRYPESIAVGDVTGDGLKDVLVGATGDTTKGSYAGAAYAFTSLAGAGLTTNFLKFYNTNAKTSDYFGRSVAIGNFDGDFKGSFPLNDVAVGAYLDKTTKNGGGAVYGFNSNGQTLSSVNSVPSFSLYDTLGSPQTLGYDSIRIVGDINGDGYDDAVGKIARPATGGTTYNMDAVVYFGSELGLVTTSFCIANAAKIFKSSGTSTDNCYPSTSPAQGITNNNIPLPQLISKPTNLSGTWATRVFDGGDINGDGFADVVFVDYNTGGQVVVYYGAAAGLQAVNNPSWVPAYGDPQIVTKKWAAQRDPYTDGDETNSQRTRRQMVYHGDLNGDGLSDIVIAAPYEAGFFTMNVSGGYQGVGSTPVSGSAPTVGWQCSSVSDSGCVAGNAPEESGRVWIYYGSATGLQTPKAKGYSGSDDEPAVNANLTSASTSYMVDVYNSEAAAATNKACTGTTTKNCKMQFLYDPFIENVEHGYDTMFHRFGRSIAILDIDHDGIDDLVVGAPGWEDIACYYDTGTKNGDYGRVFIYRGSANGVLGANNRDYYSSTYNAGDCTNASAFQATNSDSLNLSGSGKVRSLMPPIMNYSVGSNRSSRVFGMQMTTGDVNKDGYEDLVISAPNESPKSGLELSGVNYVFYGPLCGNDNVTDMWTGTLAANLNVQYLFTDAALQVPGMAECVRGTGTSKPAPMAFYVKDASANERNGYTLAGARATKGDFNGDGYDDIVVGTPYWDDQVNNNANFGRGIVFFGSATGLYTNDYPDTSVIADSSGHLKPYIIKSSDTPPSPMYFFTSPSVGDVNGDGTMDLMVPTEFHSGYSPIIGIRVGTFYMLF